MPIYQSGEIVELRALRQLGNSGRQQLPILLLGFPENYTHVGMRQLRRLGIIWSGEEISQYDRLTEVADNDGQELPEFVKAVIRRRLETQE